MRERTQMRGTTRERIVSTALRLFAEKGFAAVGIRQIASEVGLSSATLYHYMGSKDDLLQEIMTDRLGRLIAVTRQAGTGLSRPEDKLVTVVRVHVLVHALHPDSVVDHQIRDLGSKARESVIGLRDEYEEIWRSLLEEGLEQPAVFRIASPELTRLALLEMCNGVARWYRPGGKYSAEYIADYYANLTLCMVSARRAGRAVQLDATSGPPVSDLLVTLNEAYPHDPAYPP
jgi:AcrR family transcriptional regulator